LGSFELFCQFFGRMKTAVFADEFPASADRYRKPDKAPHNLKQGIRTWFKAIAGDLLRITNVLKPVTRFSSAPIREQIQQIEAIGLENYYQGLSKAIADAGEQFIADFSYTHPGA
jgi:hypothetical protein